MPAGLGSVAIVHDYLNQRGGAERVVLELGEIWPEAPIYTSLYRPHSTFPEFRAKDVRTSPVDRLPVDEGFRNLFPLYPAAFRSFGTLPQDLVISSSSGWAHGVRTRPDALHVVYCHTPARWLYEREHLGASRRRLALTPMLEVMRRWDRTGARRADLYIANSENSRERVKRAYGIDAAVVYPPVDVDRFTPSERGERLLVVSRLLPYKRVDLVVDAATRAGIGLDIVGIGPEFDDLRRRAGPTVEFHGRLPDADVTALVENCRLLCQPGTEDFGIVAVEAHAAGKPVVVFAAGGALETVQEAHTGAFFDAHETEELLDAIRRCDEIETSPTELANAARRFSREVFRSCLLKLVTSAFEQRQHRGDVTVSGEASPNGRGPRPTDGE